jgi:hypothetical protein
VNFFDVLLRSVGFRWRMRWMRFMARVRELVTVAFIMGSIGTAIGYAVARRRASDTERDG